MKVIEGKDVHLFQVDGIFEELQKSKDPSQVLKDKKVHILINDAIKKIFVCLGPHVDVRSRFFAAHEAHAIREQRGVNYQVVTVDSDPHSEEFFASLSAITSHQEMETTSPSEEVISFPEILEDQEVQLFKLIEDLFVEYRIIDFNQVLKKKNVFILINNSLKKIYLWIGLQVNTRSKLSGAFTALSIQREFGFDYRVKTIEQGNEPEDFLNSLSKIPAPQDQELLDLKSRKKVEHYGFFKIKEKSGE